jgi:hypothetical protein
LLTFLCSSSVFISSIWSSVTSCTSIDCSVLW